MTSTISCPAASGRRDPEEIALAVRTALSRITRRPLHQIQPEHVLEDDLGLDSMALIEVNIAIEEQLRTAVPAGESPELAVRTVADLIAFVLERIGSGEAASC